MQGASGLTPGSAGVGGGSTTGGTISSAGGACSITIGGSVGKGPNKTAATAAAPAVVGAQRCTGGG